MSFTGKITAIAGPTASGKTDAAYELALISGADIVSADCFQSYRRLDKGTAKPPAEFIKNIKHYMIDEYDISEPVSVYNYSNDACIYIDAKQKGSIIVTGGSGLYMDSIIYCNYTFSGESSDEGYREYLSHYLADNGTEALYEMLMKIDPEYAAKTHKNNLKRVMRAIEFYHQTGQKMSEAAQEKVFRWPDTLYYGLYVERGILYERINRRVDKMIEGGLVEEVAELYAEYKNPDLNAFKAIGYKEIIMAIENKMSYSEAIELIKKRSRNYAKRQYTWFNANKDIKWIDATNLSAKQIALFINGGGNV